MVAFRPEEFFAGLEDLAVLQVAATDPVTNAPLDAISVEFRGVGRS